MRQVLPGHFSPSFVCCNESKAAAGKALEQARPQQGCSYWKNTHKGRRYINCQCQKVNSASIHSHPTTMHNSTQNSMNHTSVNMLTNLLWHALELLLKGFLHCLAHHHYVLVGTEQHTLSVLAVYFLVVNRALSNLLVSHCKKVSGPLQFVTRIEKSDHFGHFQRCVFHNGMCNLISNVGCLSQWC